MDSTMAPYAYLLDLSNPAAESLPVRLTPQQFADLSANGMSPTLYFPVHVQVPPDAPVLTLTAFDPGELGVDGGGDVEWWHNLIASLLELAYIRYQDQVDAARRAS